MLFLLLFSIYAWRIERQEKKRAKHEQEIANLPDIRNTAEVQQYFLQQIQLGEELVQQGSVSLCVYALS